MRALRRVLFAWGILAVLGLSILAVHDAVRDESEASYLGRSTLSDGKEHPDFSFRSHTFREKAGAHKEVYLWLAVGGAVLLTTAFSLRTGSAKRHPTEATAKL